MIIAVGLLLFALFGKSDELKRAAMVVFLGIALVTIPTYITGNAAREAVCKTPPNTSDTACPNPYPGVSEAVIEAHEAAAVYGLALMELTGAFAWLGLWQFRRMARFSAWNLTAVLLLSVMTLGIMARVANIGGDIRHPEASSAPQIATTQTAGAPADRPLGRALGAWVLSTTWVWPTCETLHFVGLSLLFGVAALVDLRMLGMMKSVPFTALHRLLPWGILGFGLNTITGMFFFIGAPHQYTQNGIFYWKLTLMMLAGINVLYFTVFEEPWAVGPGDDAPFTAKAVAVSAFILVLGVLYCGRMLPFIGNAF